jgi:hypothetical protein
VKHCQPVVISVDEFCAGRAVGLDQLTDQRAEDTPAHAVDGAKLRGARVGPRVQRLEGVEPAESRLRVEVLDVAAASGDDFPGQRLLVREVVGDLRAADSGASTDVTDGRPGDAAAVHQRCGTVDDARSGGGSFSAQP